MLRAEDLRTSSARKLAVVLAPALGLRIIAFAAGVPESSYLGGPDIPSTETYKDLAMFLLFSSGFIIVPKLASPHLLLAASLLVLKHG